MFVINKTDGSRFITLQDGSVDTTTSSLGFIGRDFTGYGEIQNENFLFLLENFANVSAPRRPVTGQTWFDTSSKSLNVYNGTDWTPVNSAAVGVDPPGAVVGTLWFNPSSEQTFVYSGTEWILVGPLGVEGFGGTKVDSIAIYDDADAAHPAVILVVNDYTIAVISQTSYTIGPKSSLPGFTKINSGINISSIVSFTGDLHGNAATASKLSTPVLINNTPFDGSKNVTVSATTTGSLIKGDYIKGATFNGSKSETWSVDASPNMVIGTVVARDNTGSFSANEITAEKFKGQLIGNVSANSGISYFDKIVCKEISSNSQVGAANTAQRLSPGRKINGTLFDGSEDISIGVSGTAITGNRLASNVTESSLTVLGTLNSLAVASGGITVGTTPSISISTVNSPSIRTSDTLTLSIVDSTYPQNSAGVMLVNSAFSETNGGPKVSSISPVIHKRFNLGMPSNQYLSMYSENFIGTASSAKFADLAEMYSSDRNYEAGTVLMFGGELEVTIASHQTTKVAGVVSTDPAYLMNRDLKVKFPVAVALQGRVPCKVTGKVKKGDLLVSAGGGYAKAALSPKIGTVIGKSLEDFEGPSGVIEVVVGRV